jgi:hypothetical protein
MWTICYVLWHEYFLHTWSTFWVTNVKASEYKQSIKMVKKNIFACNCKDWTMLFSKKLYDLKYR